MKYLLCEDCNRVEREPFDVGDKCTCGGYFIEVDRETAAKAGATEDVEDPLALQLGYLIGGINEALGKDKKFVCIF